MDNNEFFKAIDSKSSERKPRIGFFKGIFVPFISGILGTTLVIGLCIHVPFVKEKLKDYIKVDNSATETSTT